MTETTREQIFARMRERRLRAPRRCCMDDVRRDVIASLLLSGVNWYELFPEDVR